MAIDRGTPEAAAREPDADAAERPAEGERVEGSRERAAAERAAERAPAERAPDAEAATEQAAAEAVEEEPEQVEARPSEHGLPLGGRDHGGEEQTARQAPSARREIPLLEAIRRHERTSAFIAAADDFLAAQGFTEHGFRHANLVGHIAFNVLTHLGYDFAEAQLAAVAGYLHDVGNVVSRAYHGQTGAMLAYDALKELDVAPVDMARILSAIGNHEEQYGFAVSPVAAAVILADKADVHRSRVRTDAELEIDIHDRVNYAVESSFLRVDPAEKTLTLELEIDTEISRVLEYFEIFLERMVMCRRAARTLGCAFKITVNGSDML